MKELERKIVSLLFEQIEQHAGNARKMLEGGTPADFLRVKSAFREIEQLVKRIKAELTRADEPPALETPAEE